MNFFIKRKFFNPNLHGVILQPILHGGGGIYAPPWYLKNGKCYDNQTWSEYSPT